MAEPDAGRNPGPRPGFRCWLPHIVPIAVRAHAGGSAVDRRAARLGIGRLDVSRSVVGLRIGRLRVDRLVDRRRGLAGVPDGDAGKRGDAEAERQPGAIVVVMPLAMPIGALLRGATPVTAMLRIAVPGLLSLLALILARRRHGRYRGRRQQRGGQGDTDPAGKRIHGPYSLVDREASCPRL